MFAQPSGHVGVLVRGVVIRDQVDPQPGRDGPVDRVEEGQKLFVGVPGQAPPEYLLSGKYATICGHTTSAGHEDAGDLVVTGIRDRLGRANYSLLVFAQMRSMVFRA